MPDTLPSLADLASRRDRGEPDRLFTLREAAEITSTPYTTIRRWVYTDRVIRVVPVGPFGRPRVPSSELVILFCQHEAGKLCSTL